jgi:hypothetical protein
MGERMGMINTEKKGEACSQLYRITVAGRRGSCSISDIFSNNWITLVWIPCAPQAQTVHVGT